MSKKSEEKAEVNRRPGREYVDPTPVAWPIGVNVPESLEQKMARMIRTSLSDYARSQGAETFEEADDFDVEDGEELPHSPHELDDDQELIMRDQAELRRIPVEFRRQFEEERARMRAQAEKVSKNKAPEEKAEAPEEDTAQ